MLAFPNFTLKSKAAAATRSDAGYPRDFDVPSIRERRYLYVARLMAFGLGLSLILNVTLVWALVSLLPLKEVRPYLISLTEDKNVFADVRPITRDMRAIDLLTESLVRDYVVYRNEIVRSEGVMKERWAKDGLIMQMSNEAEYNRFGAQMTSTFVDLRKADVTQEVMILSANRLIAQNPNSPYWYYTVDFRTTARGPNSQVISQQTWEATLEVHYQERENVPETARLVNPTGFQVTNYSVSEKITADKKATP